MIKKIVINDTVLAEVRDTSGVQSMMVVNGDWSGCIDFMRKIYYADAHPTREHKVTEWREATQEDLSIFGQ